MKRIILALVVTILALPAARAQVDLHYEITGGKEDVKNAIVALPLDIKKGAFVYAFAVWPNDGGNGYTNQFLPNGRLGSDKPELLVLVPELKAQKTLTVRVRHIPPPPGLPAPPHMMWKKVDSDTSELCVNHPAGKLIPVLRYTQFTFDPMATPPKKTPLENPTIKPYHHVYDPTGKTLLTNGPDGKYPHHRGIYFGFNNISYSGKKADVWHCRNGESQRADPKQSFTNGWWIGLHRLNVGWHGQDGAKFADETRELAAYEMTGGMLIDFRSRLETDRADGVKLDGDPQHAGFHFRANAKVEGAAKSTYFLRPDGKGKEGEEKNWEPKSKKGPVNLPWNAMCFDLEGKRYTVLYLDHPDNPKEARQSERTYGRIGTYFEYQLSKEKPLFVRYRLWIQPGEMTVEQCDAISKAFTTTVQVTKR